MSDNKRFTYAELAAEYWFMRWVRTSSIRFSDYGSPSKLDNERLATLRKFASLPHFDDPELDSNSSLEYNLPEIDHKEF